MPSGRLERGNLLVIHNPVAGRGGGVFARTLSHLHTLGCQTNVLKTANKGDAEAWARNTSGASFDAVVAAGGDGTIAEVINGLVAAKDAPPLAILPLGTANVLAVEVGLPAEPMALAEVIAAAAARPICLGRIRDQAGHQLHFSLMAGVGFDAHVVAGVSPGLKRLIGKGAYVAESLLQLGVFAYPRYRVTADGTAYDAASLIIANGRYYAGRHVCAPAAALDDPMLHVCLFERGGPLAVLRYMVALQNGGLVRRPDYRIIPARHVTIAGPIGEPVQADGDYIAALPVEIDVVPDVLRLVMPDRGRDLRPGDGHALDP